MPCHIQLHIPKPCKEQWDTMAPDARGRHCASCQKTVVDFTAMTDSQIIAHLAQAGQGVCGRFGPNQLRRNLSLSTAPDKRQGKSSWPWLLAACLISVRPTQRPSQMLMNQARTRVATANEIIRKKGTLGMPMVQIPLPDSVSMIQDTTYGISKTMGKVSVVGIDEVDLIEKPVPDTLTPDTSHLFQEEPPLTMGTVSQVVRGNIDSLEKPLAKAPDADTSRSPKHEENAFSGGINLEAGKGTDSLKELIRDTLTALGFLPSKQLIVYPNPVNRGGAVSLSWQIAPGSYEVALFNTAGALIQTRVMEVSNEQQVDLLSIPPSIATGIYILRAIQAGNRKVYTRKLLVL